METDGWIQDSAQKTDLCFGGFQPQLERFRPPAVAPQQLGWSVMDAFKILHEKQICVSVDFNLN